MNYKELLEHSYQYYCEDSEEINPSSKSHLEFLNDAVFDFTTYDSGMSELFATKAVEVCKVISDRTTFEYMQVPEDYKWFLLMCNMPFFCNKLNWGTSIRGAWWDTGLRSDIIELESSYLYLGENQLLKLQFTLSQWKEFIQAVIEFAKLNNV